MAKSRLEISPSQLSSCCFQPCLNRFNLFLKTVNGHPKRSLSNDDDGSGIKIKYQRCEFVEYNTIWWFSFSDLNIIYISSNWKKKALEPCFCKDGVVGKLFRCWDVSSFGVLNSTLTVLLDLQPLKWSALVPIWKITFYAGKILVLCIIQFKLTCFQMLFWARFHD